MQCSSSEEVVALRTRLARSEAVAQAPVRRRNADLRPWSGSGSQHAHSKRSRELPLRDRLTPLCSRWRRERGRAVVGQGGRPIALRPGVRGVQGLATWQAQVACLRRVLGRSIFESDQVEVRPRSRVHDRLAAAVPAL